MNKTVLVSLSEKSPAAITRTAYALSQAPFRRTPDRIVAITTSEGKRSINEELFESGIWQELAVQLGISGKEPLFGFDDASIRVVPDAGWQENIVDIQCEREGCSTSNFIFSVISEFSEDTGTSIVLSMDGGKGSLGVLGVMVMSLLGRYRDRICQVMVNPPFDSPVLKPQFYFPGQTGNLHEAENGDILPEERAEIILHEIPFVRTRYLLAHKVKRLPEDFCDMVEMTNSRISTNLPAPEIIFRPELMRSEIAGRGIDFSPAEFALYWLFLLRRKNGLYPVRGQKALLEEFRAFADSTVSSIFPEILNHDRFRSKNDEDMENLVSSISGKISESIQNDEGRDFCMPSRERGIYGISVQPENIDCPRNY